MVRWAGGWAPWVVVLAAGCREQFDDVRVGPTDGAAGREVVGLALGRATSYARVADGRVFAWGDGARGQLGGGAVIDRRATPALVPIEGRVVEIAAGGDTACAVVEGGAVSCWGADERGQVGDGVPSTFEATPRKVALDGPADAVAVGDGHACARLVAGGVRCWGDDGRGQLGDGASPGGPAPVAVEGLPGLLGPIALGGASSCIAVGVGARCWGAAGAGDAAAPTSVGGLAATSSIAVGARHACAALTTGALRCWGANDEGQLGTGAASPAEVSAVPVGGGLGLGGRLVLAVSAGHAHACALLQGGDVACWGANALGQIGAPAAAMAPLPIVVAGVQQATIVAAGGEHACSVASGRVRCWGGGDRGQLGGGAFAPSPAPVEVVLP